MVLEGRGKKMAHWEKIWGPVGEVLIRRSGGNIWATQGPSLNPTGDIYEYDSFKKSWNKIGGPGKTFAVGPEDPNHPYLVGLSPDSSKVMLLDYETPTKLAWRQIGGPTAQIYAGGAGIFATNPKTKDIYWYNLNTLKWQQIGGPGKTFAVSHEYIFGVSPVNNDIYRWDQKSLSWTNIGKPSAGVDQIYAGGHDLYVTIPYLKNDPIKTGDIYSYSFVLNTWTKIGGPGKMFAATDGGGLYGLSPDAKGVYRYIPPTYWEPVGRWVKIGGPAGRIFAGWIGIVLATNPQTGDLFLYHDVD